MRLMGKLLISILLMSSLLVSMLCTAVYPRTGARRDTRHGPPQCGPAMGGSQTAVSRPPNRTTSNAAASMRKNMMNDAQLRVSTFNGERLGIATSSPTHSTA